MKNLKRKIFNLFCSAAALLYFNITTLLAQDVTTAVYLQNFSVAAQESAPTDVKFNPTGTKMYMLGSTGDDVNEYDLSTAYDISTAVYLQNFSVAAQETSPQGIGFNPTGTKMYIVGTQGDDVNEYDLSTAYDISTAVYLQNFSVAAQDNAPRSVEFNPTGTKMYIVGTQGDDVNEYDLSTAYDVSTAAYLQNFSVVAQDNAPVGAYLNPTGTKMYMLGSTGDDVNEYDLSTAYDISTAVYLQNFSVAAQDASPLGFTISPDGANIYVIGLANDKVYQYSATPYETAPDTDGDGTPDSADGCPNDPLKIAAGTCGCGVADTDTDSDGTPDCNDCFPNDANLPATVGSSCDDGDSNTSNDVIQSDGCTCAGVVTCVTDADSDGVCAVDDCDDNDALIGAKQAAGTSCDDGNALTINDTISTDSCTCIGELDTDSDGTPDASDGCPSDPLKIAAGDCGCGVADTDTDSDGTPDCNDGCPSDPLKIAAGTCGCGVADTDTDSDGTPDCNDCFPNDANLPATVGSSCDDGNASTENDVIQSDGCTCAGTLPNPCAITITTGDLNCNDPLNKLDIPITISYPSAADTIQITCNDISTSFQTKNFRQHHHITGTNEFSFSIYDLIDRTGTDSLILTTTLLGGACNATTDTYTEILTIPAGCQN